MYDFKRFEDALYTRAEQISPKDRYAFMTGYMLSMLQNNTSIEDTTKMLENSIRNHIDPSNNEQQLVDLMWQHEPLKTA